MTIVELKLSTAIKEAGDIEDVRLMKEDAEYILGLLKEQSKIVRCKDCRWYDEKISFCDNCHLPREQTFFCADGKRR